MRTDSHIPCSERNGTKQESAIKRDTEAEGTPQVLAFVPKIRIGKSSEPGKSPSVLKQRIKGSCQLLITERIYTRT